MAKKYHDYILAPTKRLPIKELKRRIRHLTPKGKYASRAVWESISDYQKELKKKELKVKIRKFTKTGYFKIHKLGGVTKISLQHGEGKRLQQLGIKRKEQIKMLDLLEDNPKLIKKLFQGV